MHDVAAAAGVSLVTVSRSLRQPSLVNAETRERISVAIERLGYIPDAAAGSLASKRSGIVAVIVPSLDNAVFSSTVQGLTDQLAAHDLDLMVGCSGLGDEKEERLVRTFLGRRPEGFVLTGISHSRATRDLLRAADIPVVETWNLTRRPIDVNVGFSNIDALAAVTNHIIAAGRRNLAFMGGSLLGNDRARDRRKGFLEAVNAAGLRNDLLYELPFPQAVRAVAPTVRQILADAPDVDAIVCSGDAFAITTIFACQQMDLKVPERIAVAGLGDIEMSEHIRPAVTTANVPGYEMGRAAANAIAERRSGRKPRRKIIDLGYEVIARDST